MKKLYIKKVFDYDYAGGKTFDGYIIVENPRDDEWYAKVWTKPLAETVRKALQRAL